MDLFQMDFFIYILILMLLVGAFFVVYGSIVLKDAKSAPKEEQELLSIAKKLDTLESSVFEADEAVNMLDDMSKNVFKEFDSKYQELLFLYNLVDEKQKTLAIASKVDTVVVDADTPVSQGARHPEPIVLRDVLLHAGAVPGGVIPTAPKQKLATVTKPIAVPQIIPGGDVASLDVVVDDSTKSNGINPKFAHVLQLSKDGKSVEEIARELDMGKGEIMLILNLGGRRQNA